MRKHMGNLSAVDAQEKQYRVFIVDDYELQREGLRRVIDNAPEGDMVVVGEACENANLVSRVKEARANVIIVDIALGKTLPLEEVLQEERTNGLRAISTLRDAFKTEPEDTSKPPVAIIVLTAYGQYLAAARRAGAHRAMLKLSTNEELRQAIREVVDSVIGHKCVIIDEWLVHEVKRIKIFLAGEDRKFILFGDRDDRTPEIRLGSQPFVFLYYLTEERVRGEKDWVVRTSGEKLYRLREKKFWDEICKRKGGRFDLDNDVIYKWKTTINEAVEPYITSANHILIKGPRQGRHGTGSYSLNLTIKTVEFSDQRIAFPSGS
jgi:DNA-binding NarL/FixJ family response regulator